MRNGRTRTGRTRKGRTGKGRAWTVLTLAAALAVTGCSTTTPGTPIGSGAAPAAGDHADNASLAAVRDQWVQDLNDTPWPMRPVDPSAALSAVSLDADNAVTTTIGPAGGDISVTADDVTYTLHLPADALVFDTEITLTPIERIEGLADLPLHGVDLQPHGLQLIDMGELEIDGLPDEPILGFAYSDAGFDLRATPMLPDPDRVAIPVPHFSGAGVGPFAALGEALQQLPTHSGPTTEVARASAQLHNKAPGTTLDQLADLYSQMIKQLQQMIGVAHQQCNAEEGWLPADAYQWTELAVQFEVDQGLDASLKSAVRGLVDALLSCWGDADNGQCLVPTPEMMRQLQGIKRLLVRWNALDEAAAKTGKRNVRDYAFCSAWGYVNYRYEEIGHSITATLDIKFEERSDGPEVINERSKYTIGEISVSDDDCVYVTHGYGSFHFGELPPGSEIAPQLDIDVLDDGKVALFVAPVYYFKTTTCRDSNEGWVADLALGCNPDGTGSDSIIGSFLPEIPWMASFACHDESMNATATGVISLGQALDKIIPPDLWE